MFHQPMSSPQRIRILGLPALAISISCASSFDRGVRPWLDGEPAHDIDQLTVGIAGGIAEFGNRVRLGKLAEAGELADALPPAELQLGWPMGEQDAPQLALAEEMVEFGRRD